MAKKKITAKKPLKKKAVPKKKITSKKPPKKPRITINAKFFEGVDRGTLSEDELVRGFQKIINKGMRERIVQKYKNIANMYIEMGLCKDC